MNLLRWLGEPRDAKVELGHAIISSSEAAETFATNEYGHRVGVKCGQCFIR